MSLKKNIKETFLINGFSQEKAGKNIYTKKLVVVLMRTTIDWLEVGKP